MCVVFVFFFLFFVFCFFFQAEDGIRDLVRSRGLGMCIRDRGSARTVTPKNIIKKLTDCPTSGG